MPSGQSDTFSATMPLPVLRQGTPSDTPDLSKSNMLMVSQKGILAEVRDDSPPPKELPRPGTVMGIVHEAVHFASTTIEADEMPRRNHYLTGMDQRPHSSMGATPRSARSNTADASPRPESSLKKRKPARQDTPTEKGPGSAPAPSEHWTHAEKSKMVSTPRPLKPYRHIRQEKSLECEKRVAAIPTPKESRLGKMVQGRHR